MSCASLDPFLSRLEHWGSGPWQTGRAGRSDRMVGAGRVGRVQQVRGPRFFQQFSGLFSASFQAHGNPIESYGNPLESYGNPMEPYQNPMASNGNPIGSHGNLMEISWRESFANPMESCGNPGESYPNPMESHRDTTESDGNIIEIL